MKLLNVGGTEKVRKYLSIFILDLAIERNSEDSNPEAERERCQMAISGWSKTVSRSARRWKSGGYIIQNFKNNKYRKKRSCEGKKIGKGTEKQLNW